VIEKMKEKTALFAGILINVTPMTGVVAEESTRAAQEEIGGLRRHGDCTVIGLALGLLALFASILFIFVCTWLSLALFGIGSFICLLIWMDRMTYDARNDMKKRYEHLLREKNKEKMGEYEKKEMYQLFKNYIETLPLADRIAIIQPEPVGVFDHHEIRRSLTISLTIVYFTLLPISVFEPDSLFIAGNPMVELFMWVYLTVIIFYFGSRGLEKYAEVRMGKEKK